MRRNSSRMNARLAVEGLEAREVPALVGALDPSFDTDGKIALTGVPLHAVALQADGKVVVAGASAATTDFFLARYNPDGSLDKTFDGDGIKTIDFGGTDKAADLVLQADGKIVVVGSSTAGSGDFAVARVNPDGSLDAAFNPGGPQPGTRLIDFSAGADAANSVGLQADGKIVVVGTDATGSGGGQFAVARLNPADGSLDTGFNATGKKTIEVSAGKDVAEGVAFQANGNILIAGTTGADFAVVSLAPAAGAFDAGFNAGAPKVLDLGGTDDAHDIAVTPGGKILVAGSNGTDMAVVRLNTDATLDTSFNPAGTKTGVLTVDVGGADDARTILQQADGRLVLVGDSGADVAVVRVTPTGTLDTTFNVTGKATFDLGTAADIGSAAALSPSGRVVVAGQNASGTNGTIIRVTTTTDESRTVAVGGSLDGKAVVYAGDPATGKVNATALATVSAFGTLNKNVRAATGDVNGDGTADVVVVTGAGVAIQLAVVSGADNKTLLVQPFDPFGGGFTGGGFVAVADFDNDGRADVVVTPDQGGGPRVSIFSLGTDGKFTSRASFFGIDDPNFRGGARPGTGDVDGDGFADLAVAAGFQGGPRVSLYDGETLFSTAENGRLKLVNDFFAFEDVLRNGVYVTIGDLDGDGKGDLVFGAGPGGSPRFLAVSGAKLLADGAVAALASPVANFFVAGNDANRGGVRVSSADLDGDNKADIITGTGEFQPSKVRVYFGKTFGVASGEPAGSQDLDPFSGATFSNGIYVG